MLCKHLNVYDLIDAFRKVQKKVEAEIIKFETGFKAKRKNKYIELDERIQNVLSTYSKNKFDDFKDNLSIILKY